MVSAQPEYCQPPRFELADIFRKYGKVYRGTTGITAKQHAVMSAIENCRTSQYGYHVDQCDTCGHIDYDFNSCRDRHCPKCQGVSRQKWVKARLSDLLPVPYYHIVFTLPHLLHSITLYNKQLVYELLFDSASKTLLSFGRDPKWLGGEIGFYGILHSWGQTMWQHAHVHFIVPGGALTERGRWVQPKYGNKFLFPVRALSKVFRGKFIELLKKAYDCGDLVIPDTDGYLSRKDQFEQWINMLVNRDWVVYCKPPLGDAEQVVAYIGRYTHRVAISNHRIISIEKDHVCFWYKDYKANNMEWDKITLKSHEFIRRFLWHVLPEGFHKIRHYGFLANGRCKAKLARIREMLNIHHRDDEPMATHSPVKCPKCGIGSLWPIRIINRWGHIIARTLTLNGPGYAFDTW